MPAAEFVSLADVLLRAGPPPRFDTDETPGAGEETVDGVPLPDAAAPDLRIDAGDEDVRDALRDALREARLFRARLADAFEDALDRLLRELAADVLARELRLEPCDLRVLVERVAQHAPFVRVRVAVVDPACDYGLQAVADPALDAGDAVLELAGGALDLRLGVRLASVLQRPA